MPSIGGGIGIANVEFTDATFGGVACGSVCDEDETDFAWQLGAGLRHRFASGFTIGADYRYFRVETDDDALDAHKVLVTIGTGF